MKSSKARNGMRRRNPQNNNAKFNASNAMPIPILMYHQIDIPPVRGTPLRGLTVAPKSFEWQMKLLRYLGYRGLSMRDLEPFLSGARVGKVVGITFDDGYQNNVEYALPVLQKNRFTATCYGVSSMIGATNVWDAGKVEPKRLMTLENWKACTLSSFQGS